jgi:two-component system cell cycle response regulator DivK
MQNNATILYVEDTFENRILIRRILQADGFTVIEAENAASAFDILNDATPDLILMDINMPDIDGYTLTTQLRNIPKLFNVPIVALTANVMRGDRERSLAAGCDGYIQKPVDVDTLPEQIRHYLNR